jgi:hypothetical protein
MVGEVVCSMMLTYLLGTLLWWVASFWVGKGPIAARRLFTLVAAALVGAQVLGQYHINAFQRDDARRQINVEPAVPHANQADSKILMAFARAADADTDKQNQSYKADLSEIIGDGILRPGDLSTAEKISSAKAKLAKLRSLIEGNERIRLAMLDEHTSRFNALPLSAAERDSCRSQFQNGFENSRELIKQVADIDAQYINEGAKLVDFMESRLGTFRVKEAIVYFSDASDVSRYNAILAQLTALQAEEQQVTQKSQQSADALNEIAQTSDTQ